MHYHRLSLILFSLAIACTPIVANDAPALYRAIEAQHTRSFPPNDQPAWDESSFYKYVMRYFDDQKKPTESKKRTLAFNVLKSMPEASTRQPGNRILDQNSWEDLNLFFNKSGPQHCLAEIINRASTEIGRVTLYRMLAEPTGDAAELSKRQAIIRELVENEQLFFALLNALQQVRTHENLMLAYWDIDSFKTTSRSLYFDIDAVRQLNNSEYALAFKNLSDHAQRLIFMATNGAATFILPVYAVSRILKLNRPEWFDKISGNLMSMSGPVAACSAAFIANAWAQGFISMGSAACSGLWAAGFYDWQRGSMAMSTVLGIRVTHAGAFLNAIQHLGFRAWYNTILKEMPAVAQMKQFFDPTAQHAPGVRRLLGLLTSGELEQANFITRPGKTLLTYKLMNDHKDGLLPAIEALGELDAYMSIATLYKEFEDKQVKFSFVRFEDAHKPHIKLTNFWNPFIPHDKVVANSVELGGSQCNNMIVTGPNAGGKSTTLKGIAINLIMAQTFGIVPAEEAVITPFTKIASYLNITDDIVAGHSLFKAEVMRAHNLIETVEQLGPKQFSFVILDEIFNGTSPHEGEAAAYGTAKHLGKFDRSIAIVATHFPLLTNLENASKAFTNYRVRVNKTDDGKLHYPFMIERGISDQNVALDMLRLEGFKSDILKEAEGILKDR